jgi:hypothetical protein
MPGVTNAFETSLLGLIVTNVNAANVGDATGLRGSTVAGVFWISLHVSDPGETGDQTTGETVYTTYARQDEARDAANWTVTGNTADNDLAIPFPTCGATGATLSHFGLGSAVSGTGNLFMFGQLSSNLAVSNGITPSFAIGALDITLD